MTREYYTEAHSVKFWQGWNICTKHSHRFD